MSGEYLVDICGLKYAYPVYAAGMEGENILRGLDLQIKKGEFVSIMGPTGAGKTTLCLTLNGIIPHSTGGKFGGNVLICGINTKKTTIAELAKKAGIVFQDPESQLFSMTVADEVAFGLENLGVPREEMKERVYGALQMVDMTAFAERSPFHLSGGQKQRVAIASILVMEPEILVLDEPTAELDPIGKSEVFRVVNRLRNEKAMTIIMVEHESERIAEFSDRVLIMDQGRIVMEGPPGEIFNKTEQLRAIGVSIPQMAELSSGLRQRGYGDCNFITLEEGENYFAGKA
ncbi:MAG: ATP-binding cassette domain-containing protein [Treponema sp.]|nr:ATP-binding cassette domain-containing protein [Treponema sp.]